MTEKDVDTRMSQKAITANRVLDGAVVWRTGDGGWNDAISAAAPFSPEESATVLEAAKADVAHRLIVDPYDVDIDIDEAGIPVPLRLRERLRAYGPSVRTDGSRQAHTQGPTR